MSKTAIIAALYFVIAAVLASEAGAAADLSTVRVAVVPDARTMPKRVRATIDRQVTGPLGQRVRVIPARRALQAVKRQGAGMPTTGDAAATLGAELDATQVLLLSSEQGQRRGQAQLVATLVDVSTGESQEIGRFEMRRGRLSGKSGRRLIQRVTQKLGHLATAQRAESAAPAVAESSTAASSGTSPWDSVGSDSAGSSSTPPWAAAEPTVSASKSIEGTGARREKAGETFRLGLGAVAFQRSSEVGGAAGGSPRRFETDGWIPGIAASFELFPFADLDSQASGVGLYANGYAARLVNLVEGDAGYDNATVIYSVDGGVAYRVALWDSPRAPVLHGGLGYAKYAFPVDSELFPALGYSGPRGALELTVPIAGSVVVALGGAYALPIGLHGDAAALGTYDLGASRAYSGDASVRMVLSNVEVNIFAGMQRFSLTFEGMAAAQSLAGVTDIAVSDATVHAGLTVGLAL